MFCVFEILMGYGKSVIQVKTRNTHPLYNTNLAF